MNISRNADDESRMIMAMTNGKGLMINTIHCNRRKENSSKQSGMYSCEPVPH